MDNAVIETQALQLPEDARALLADKLINSLSSTQDSETLERWAVESDRRFEAYREGKLSSESAEDVMQRMRNQLHTA